MYLDRYGAKGAKESLNLSFLNSLSNQEIGIRMLIQLPEKFQVVFEELRENPELIFESLVRSSAT